MSPPPLKVAAVVCALLSVGLLTAAVRAWRSRGGRPGDASAERSGWRGGLTLLGVTGLVFGSIWIVAPDLGWPRDRALWVGFGAFLGLMTLLRPWWFWDNWRAHGLRQMIGDEATAVLYLALAGVMVWVGLYTAWTFGGR